ncbi:MAG: valine--tRNA ligase [Candidatus Spechtbacterales bacterium]|nr:valine--tRNA ligase [Candidatus Spechtbacterales bacterium]
MSKELGKRFNYSEREPEIYKLWEESGFFNPDNLPKGHKDPFCILIPPPNANDPLHIGHALFVSLQDMMTRYARMRGKKALWLPGMDHAGFETQVVYEKKLKKQGKTRLDMERDEFYKQVWDYTQKNRDTVRGQLKKLGASADWSREVFTLDDKIINTVYRTFKKMYDDELIYRGERLVNYCTTHQTAFSDLEIVREERKDPLYYIKYGPLTLATVRPETKFGDTAIAVNPDDKRYKEYIGKEIEIETVLGKKKMKVIADEYVDPEFGTGVVKITPAHDENDFEVWLRHKDEIPGPVETIDKNGRMTSVAGPYEGMKIMEAREKIVEDMKNKGLIEKIEEDYKHSVALCYKCKNIIEPMLMRQWFVKMEPLAKPAIDVVKKGEIKIIPSNQKKVYMHWMKNIKDWNISRQNWWGIEIPAWKCTACSEGKENETWIITEGEEPKKCPDCNKKDNLVRDPDVFDTWFSSGQWPFATLDYPNGDDFKTFYPTDIMETGYDILFFWVARMIMLGLYRTGEIPFNTVYLHGLVRDKDRQKMSKSKGNVIDPLGVVEEYGTDALRMALLTNTTPGRDPVLNMEQVRGYRNFSTKLWNVTRFLLMNVDAYSTSAKEGKEEKKMQKEIKATAKSVTKNMEKYRYAQAAEEVYHYAWHRFADELLEESKEIIFGDDAQEKSKRVTALINAWADVLKLLHPFMPFVTEELYGHLPIEDKKMLIIEKWPEA